MPSWLSLYPIDRSPFGHFKTSVVLLVRVVHMYWVFWVVGSNPTVFHINFFFQIDLHFHEHFQLEISSKCDIKAENSSTLCKFHKGRKGLRPVGSYANRSPRAK